MNDHSSLPPFPGPLLPILHDSAVASDITSETSDPPVFDVLYVTPDQSGYPLVVARDLPPQVSDIARIIHTEPHWEVFSGWSDLGSDLRFEVAIRRPVVVRFALRFHDGSLGHAMATILRAGGFTFAGAIPDQYGHLRLRSIITFVVDADKLLDTLAELRPSVV